MLFFLTSLSVCDDLLTLSGSSGTGFTGIDDDIRFPILANPLLAVAQLTWLETAISANARSWVPHFPPRFGEPEGTMRGSDPALPTPIRARCDAMRDWSARLLAFAVPNRRAVSACRRAVEACGGKGSGIVEVGAGLGYWKWVLENDGIHGRGGRPTPARLNGKLRASARQDEAMPGQEEGTATPLNIFVIDKDPSRLPSREEGGGTADVDEKQHARRVADRERAGRGGHCGGRREVRGGRRRGRQPGPLVCSNEYHGGAPGWANVEEGNPERLRSLNAGAYPVLLLCYPPPSINGGGRAPAACMGVDALAKFGGKLLLYVGEIGGDTGSPRLEAALQAGWDMVEEVELPCFSSTASRLMVFTRKGGVFVQPSRFFVPTWGINTPTEEQFAAGMEDASAGGLKADSEPGVIVDNGGGWGPARVMYRCAGCGAADGDGTRLHRCRLTRAVAYCSAKCLFLDSERYRANLEARHVHLRGGSARSAGESGGLGCFGGMFRDKKLFKRLAV